MPRASCSVVIDFWLYFTVPFRLQSPPWFARFLYSTEKSLGVCKASSELGCQGSQSNVRSDALCPLLRKVFGQQLNCVSPEVIIFQPNFRKLYH